jgi:hypothetical protein
MHTFHRLKADDLFYRKWWWIFLIGIMNTFNRDDLFLICIIWMTHSFNVIVSFKVMIHSFYGITWLMINFIPINIMLNIEYIILLLADFVASIWYALCVKNNIIYKYFSEQYKTEQMVWTSRTNDHRQYHLVSVSPSQMRPENSGGLCWVFSFCKICVCANVWKMNKKNSTIFLCQSFLD